MLKFLVRLLYLPFFLLVGNGSAIFLVERGYSEAWLIVLLVSFIALAFLAEKLAPYDAAFNTSPGDRTRDFFHALVSESLSVMGVMSVPVIASFISLPVIWPTSLPLWQQLLMAVLIADVGITLVHYLSHRVNVLWRLHAVHHSVKRMYALMA